MTYASKNMKKAQKLFLSWKMIHNFTDKREEVLKKPQNFSLKGAKEKKNTIAVLKSHLMKREIDYNGLGFHPD